MQAGLQIRGEHGRETKHRLPNDHPGFGLSSFFPFPRGSGEPCFIPSPFATSEDDGVVLSLVMSSNGTSFALVLDGKTMKEVGRAQMPYAAPYRFHGAFVPSA